MHARKMFVIAVFVQFGLCLCARRDAIVYPQILEERMAGETMLLKITDDITLNLERSTVLADELLFVTSDKHNHDVERVDTSSIQKTLYQDTHRQSSVMVRNTEGAVQVEGVLGSELRIKPLLERERSLEGQIPHRIYEVDERATSKAIGAPHRPNAKRGLRTFTKNKPVKHNATTPEKFTVEVHILSDSRHQINFKKNEELIAYMAIMTNAVNLRYMDMRKPMVNFMLVGITRSRDDVFIGKVQGYLEAHLTLNGLKKYIDDGKVPGNPDILYLVTGMDLAEKKDGKVDNFLEGYAFIGTVCRKDKAGEGEDIATTYSGVHIMAHELCHVMGAHHDTFPECPWEAGYLMSYVDGGLKRYRPSPCSVKAMQEVYRKLPPDCIQVHTKTNYMTKYKQYPGQTVRELYFCKKRVKKPELKLYVRKTDALVKNCTIECCHDINQGRTRHCWIYKVLSGTSCGEGKTCKRGVCGAHKKM